MFAMFTVAIYLPSPEEESGGTPLSAILNCPRMFPAGSNTEHLTTDIEAPSFVFTVTAVRKFMRGFAEVVSMLSRD